MQLPTLEEIDAAYELFDSDGPLPLAQVCDRHEHLNFTVRLFAAQIRKVDPNEPEDVTRLGVEQIIKAAIVTGLNLGIRIGEGRRR